MSDLDESGFQWRDTYFIWFASKRRPSLGQIEKALKALPARFELQNAEADESGAFETITLLSPQDHSAIEISYLEGDDLREQAQSLAEEVKETEEDVPAARLARLASSNARLDLMLFEQVDDEAEEDEMFDPSTLLIVLEALAKLVDGIGVDPQSGLLA